MPEFHQDWLRPLPAPPPTYFIEAVMLFPTDEESREAHLQSGFADGAARFARWTGSRISGNIAHWLREAPREKDVCSQRRWDSIHASGQFAAWALCYVLQEIADDRPEMASITRATNVAAAKPGARAWETLDKAWKGYSGVAHLWLAFFGGLAGRFNPWGEEGHGNWDVLLRWLTFAEDLRRQGEAWTPEHARNPILDPAKTWQIPHGFELPTIHINILSNRRHCDPIPRFQGAYMELDVLENILEFAQG